MEEQKAPQFTDKELHCIARLIQNSFQAPEQEKIEETYRPLYGCMYCKYAVTECNKPEKVIFMKILRKLRELTGVNVSTHSTEELEHLASSYLPESHYLEHPEDLHYLERIHHPDEVKAIKVYLDKLIVQTKETSGQKQDSYQGLCHNQNDACTDYHKV